jgi:hypothetical protein
LRPTLSSGLPFQVPSERSNKSIGRYAKTFRNIYNIARYRVKMSAAIPSCLKKCPFDMKRSLKKLLDALRLSLYYMNICSYNKRVGRVAWELPGPKS